VQSVRRGEVYERRVLLRLRAVHQRLHQQGWPRHGVHRVRSGQGGGDARFRGLRHVQRRMVLESERKRVLHLPAPRSQVLGGCPRRGRWVRRLASRLAPRLNDVIVT
jgi:hypothetical protein